MASALACGCSSNPAAEDFNEYAAKYTVSENPTAESLSDISSSDSEVLNTSYKKVTPLFRAIELEKWESVILFLSTGKWSNSMFTSVFEHMKSPSPEIQCKTWVTSYDRKGNPEWSQLPLHAAISYMAPFVVIQRLIELYPKAIQCTDNEGMLPIHLAFGFGAPDNILALLLEPFPASVNERGLGGRYPYECCELGPSKIRGRIFSIITEQAMKRVRAEMERDWKFYAMSAKKTYGVDGSMDLSNKKLSEFLFELIKDRKELQELKRSAPIETKATALSPRATTSPRSLATELSSPSVASANQHNSVQSPKNIKQSHSKMTQHSKRPAQTSQSRMATPLPKLKDIDASSLNNALDDMAEFEDATPQMSKGTPRGPSPSKVNPPTPQLQTVAPPLGSTVEEQRDPAPETRDAISVPSQPSETNVQHEGDHHIEAATPAIKGKGFRSFLFGKNKAKKFPI